jgi:hypothetical protein
MNRSCQTILTGETGSAVLASARLVKELLSVVGIPTFDNPRRRFMLSNIEPAVGLIGLAIAIALLTVLGDALVSRDTTRSS